MDERQRDGKAAPKSRSRKDALYEVRLNDEVLFVTGDRLKLEAFMEEHAGQLTLDSAGFTVVKRWTHVPAAHRALLSSNRRAARGEIQSETELAGIGSGGA